MGWFCSEIIAQPSPRLMDALWELPNIGESLYFVDSLPESKPNIPRTGLVFVRNLGELWGDMMPGPPWPELPASREMPLSIPPDLPKIRTMEQKDVSLGLPERFLKLLKWLSHETGSVVAYYSAFSWGGPFEWECAWIFEPRERVYCKMYGDPCIRVYREGRQPSEEPGNVLVMTLWRLGVDSPRWDFLPHDSRFDWSKYRVPPPDSNTPACGATT